MEPEDLKEDDLRKILEIYHQETGGYVNYMINNPSYIESRLSKINHMGDHLDLRVGSKWTSHSKLQFSREAPDYSSLKVTFSPNFDPKERKGKKYEEVLQIKERFEKRVKEYLEKRRRHQKEKGLASKIVGVVGLVGIICGTVFLSTNIIGNVIGNLNQVTSNLIGVVLLSLGLIFSYVYLRKK